MNDVEFIITLKIKGKAVEMTPDELQQLRDKIDMILGKDKHTYIPYTPVVPDPPKNPWSDPWQPSTPWYGNSPIITCEYSTKVTRE